MNSNIERPGSGRGVNDFSLLCEGDIEPTTNKEIDTLIDSEIEYIVFLDTDGWIWWSAIAGTYDSFGSSYATIANAIADLESQSLQPLLKTQRGQFSRLVSEAMARLLGDRDEMAALESLKLGRKYLTSTGAKNACRWYLETSIGCGALLSLIVFLLWIWRFQFAPYLGGQSEFDLLLGFLFGGIGSAIVVMARLNSIPMDPELGPYVHRVECIARLIVGGFGGLVAALFARSGQIAFLSGPVGGSLRWLILICFAAGYSERIMPSIIMRAEKSVVVTNSSDDEKSRSSIRGVGP